jgi:hypothetical protein
VSMCAGLFAGYCSGLRFSLAWGQGPGGRLKDTSTPLQLWGRISRGENVDAAAAAAAAVEAG